MADEKGPRLHFWIALVLLLLAFLHGAFASGFVPILNRTLGPQAPLAFALYFVGLLLGQLSIYLFQALNARRWNYPLYEMGFGLSLIYMAFFHRLPGFLSGRLFEGLMGGLATPPLFNYLVTLNVFGGVGKRVALFNSVFALGYVLGPLLVEGLQLLMPYTQALLLSGSLFIAIPLSLLALPVPAPPPPDRALSLKIILGESDWFEKFFTLFLAKSVYGYLIAFTAGYIGLFLPGTPLAQVMLGFSVLFVTGQILSERLLRVFPKQHLEVWLPLVIGGLLLTFLNQQWPGFIFILALFHSGLVYVGTLNFGLKAASAREFALFSCLSDPAMILGAGLASWGLQGIWGILLLLLVPALRALAQPPQQTRAEALFPWLGPLSIARVFRKQQAPLLTPAQDAIPVSDLILYEVAAAEHSPRLRLLLAGDLCPAAEMPQGWTPELARLIASHDLAALNLEGVVAETAASGHFHALTLKQLEPLLYDQGQPLFPLISLVNNHALDQGAVGFERSRTLLARLPGITALDSGFRQLSCQGLRIGVLALSFGSNLLIHRHRDLKLLKPEDLLRNPHLLREWQERIRQYRAEVDLLLLSWHWGYEAELFPTRGQQQVFQALAEAGLDLLWGHHSHLVQPVERWGSALCVYSCGNLTSNLPQAPYQQGCLWSLALERQTDGGWFCAEIVPHFCSLQNGLLTPLPLAQSLLYSFFQEPAHATAV